MLIQNAVYCPECCAYLVSTHGHHCVRCRHGYMVDGGLEYSRRSGPVRPDMNYVIVEGADRAVIKNKLLWGSYGKDGKGPLKRRPLKELETSHLEAILRTQTQSALYKSIIEELLQERSENQEDGGS
ncbi:hypothetical protein DFJ77DRAFT_437945 [Powellomyces hirtus]|nr:hypothetical protein DFJ77DRAFT_437945 [Powellomyces hirtus]